MHTLAHALTVVTVTLAAPTASAFECPSLPEMTEVMPGYDQIYSDANFSVSVRPTHIASV